jgi:hypothetical protein
LGCEGFGDTSRDDAFNAINQPLVLSLTVLVADSSLTEAGVGAVIPQ